MSYFMTTSPYRPTGLYVHIYTTKFYLMMKKNYLMIVVINNNTFTIYMHIILMEIN